MKKTRLSISIPEEQAAEIARRAKAESRSVSAQAAIYLQTGLLLFIAKEDAAKGEAAKA